MSRAPNRLRVGGTFDPEEFDIAAVNRALAGLLVRRAQVQ